MPNTISGRIEVDVVEMRRSVLVARWLPAGGGEPVPFAGWVQDRSAPGGGNPHTSLVAYRDRLGSLAQARLQEGFREEDTAAVMAWFRALPEEDTRFVDEEHFLESVREALADADTHDDAYRATKAMEARLFCVTADEALLEVARGRIERLRTLPGHEVEHAVRGCAVEALLRLRASSAVWRGLAPGVGLEADGASPRPPR